MQTTNTTDKKALVFTMQKVGSSSVMRALESYCSVDRGYLENIVELMMNNDYDIIISMMRDPVAQSISWLFEQKGQEYFDSGATFFQIREDYLNLKIAEHTFPLRWFDICFQKGFMPEIYGHKFDKKAGFIIINDKHVILKTEMLSKALPKAMKKFGMKVQCEHRANTVFTRPYGILYKEFVDALWLDSTFLYAMYRNAYMDYFYTEKEIKRMMDKWQKKK